MPHFVHFRLYKWDRCRRKFKNLFMLSLRISSYGCTREVLPLNVVDDQLVSVLFPVNVFRSKFAAAGLRQICETRDLRVFLKFGFIFAACWIRT